MKKLSKLAIYAMAALAMTLAMGSCKKESQNVKSDNNNQAASHFDPSHITDMNAYFKEFRQKIQAGADSKEGETLSLEEAAWHFSSLANIDFCRINVEYEDFQFDTVEMQVDIANGALLMSDFCAAYEQMRTVIQQFKKSFSHPRQNLYFIKVSLDAEGNAKIALMTSYSHDSRDLYTHQWYYSDFYEAAWECSDYFSDDSTFYWNTTAARELQRVLNIKEHHENGTGGLGPVICYIPTRDHSFNYTNTFDPYGSQNYYFNDSRVFAKRYEQLPPAYILSDVEMCYCLDSYLGLAYDYIDDGLYVHEFPVNWTVTPLYLYKKYSYYIYHELYVEFGRPYAVN